RSIPIFIFLNDNYEQETVWGPRAQIVQKFVDDVRSTHLPNKEDANYEDMLNETHVIISNRYKTDSTLWQAVYDSIITKLS
ncbi:thioredoxin family protein, partial [Staphylococcus epidermidis]